jgi:hypothetical protein
VLKHGVFISYRRIDSAGFAGRLFDHLSRHFGSHQVFMDIEGGIERGADFPEEINKALQSAAAMIVVIGQQWLVCTDAEGNRRLDKPDDWVRHEVAFALRRNILLLPVLVDNVSMPSPEQLPGDIIELARKHASDIRNSSWDYDVGQITKSLERVLQPIGSKLAHRTKRTRRLVLSATFVAVGSFGLLFWTDFAAYLLPLKSWLIRQERIVTLISIPTPYQVDRVRIALIIGNSQYKNSPLTGPENDIEIIADSLRGAGFRVKVLPNGSKQTILDAWKEIETVATYGGVALLYYSGHGFRHEGEDMILPIDVENEPNLSNRINVSSLMRSISAIGGKLEGTNGELVLYSTAPGGMAADVGPDGKTSPFATAFARAVKETKGDIMDVFEYVSSETKKMTYGKQVPWISGSFSGSFKFNDRSGDKDIGILRLIVFDASRP